MGGIRPFKRRVARFHAMFAIDGDFDEQAGLKREAVGWVHRNLPTFLALWRWFSGLFK